MRDLYNNFAAVPALAPSVKTAAADGAPIDLKGFNAAMIVLNTGTVAGDGDFGAKLQESDRADTGFADVADADRLGTFPATLAANAVYRVGYIGSKRKRYVRLVLTKAGGTSIAASAVAVLGQPAIAPVAA